MVGTGLEQRGIDSFLVMCRDDRGYRWIDSLWVVEASAHLRVGQVVTGMVACGRPVADGSWGAWVVTVHIEDASLIPAPVPSDSSTV